MSAVALFFLLVVPLFQPSVVFAQGAEGCNCAEASVGGYLEINRISELGPGAKKCCFFMHWFPQAVQNECSSNVTAVAYQLINPPSCFDRQYIVYRYTSNEIITIFNPALDPLPYTLLNGPIEPGHQYLTPELVLCPVESHPEVNNRDYELIE